VQELLNSNNEEENHSSSERPESRLKPSEEERRARFRDVLLSIAVSSFDPSASLRPFADELSAIILRFILIRLFPKKLLT
jgi:hypothetical protein